MLDTYGHGPGVASPDITYDYQGDQDPRRQDAAKVVVPADKVHIPNQVRLPIPPVSGGSLLITWDAWWGQEFRFANTDIGTYKSFNVASPADNTRMDHRTRFDRAQGTSAVGMVDVRYSADGDPWGPNMLNNLPIAPQAAQFAVQPETWTRYWVYFNPVGAFQEYSLWVADEQNGPVVLIDRVQVMPSSRSARREWESFWLEYDTSSKSIPARRGPLVGYVRNVVMLRNVPDVMSLLERPEK
jgi:hypothetical protein